MLAGQTFINYQEMYQRAVKVARVLEETEKETKGLNLEKRKQEDYRLNARNQTGKKNKPTYSPGKGKQLSRLTLAATAESGMAEYV